MRTSVTGKTSTAAMSKFHPPASLISRARWNTALNRSSAESWHNPSVPNSLAAASNALGYINMLTVAREFF